MLAGLTAMALVTAGAQEKEAAKKDLTRLQGEWAMVSGERDGQAFPADFMKGSKRTAEGDQVTVIIQGQLLMKAKFALDPAKSPRTIDYTVSSGANAGKTMLGIYELDGDKVKFCFSTPGKERPTTFTTQPNDGRTLSVWKKEPK